MASTQEILSQIDSVFKAAQNAIVDTSGKIGDLQKNLKTLSELQFTDIKEFTTSLQSLVDIETKYAGIAKKRAQAVKLADEAQAALNQTTEQTTKAQERQAKTVEDVYKQTQKQIQGLKAEIQAMADYKREIEGEMVNVREALKEKQKLTTERKENTKWLQAEAAAERAKSATLDPTRVVEMSAAYQNMNNSLKDLEAQNTTLRNIAKGLNITDNAEELQKYNDIISANSFLIKANSDAATQQALNIGNYKSATEEAGGAIKTQSERLQELTKQYFELQNQMKEGMPTRKNEEELHRLAKAILEVQEQMKEGTKTTEETTNKAESYRQKIKEITQELGALEEKRRSGQTLSAQEMQRYEELKKAGAKYVDLLGDIKGQMRTMASDTYGFDVITSSVKIGTSALQAYKAGIEMLGLSNKSYQKTMREFIALQSMVNGLTQLSNQLQDKSALMTALNNAAMSKNIALKWAATAAQKALNAAIKAAPYVAAAAAIGYVIKVIAEYIYKSKQLGQMTEENQRQFENMQAALTTLSTDYMTTAARIENYRAALNSANITEEGEKRILSQLNKLLKDQKIHFDDIKEAKEWLNDNDLVMTMQREAIATAMFQFQVEELKTKLNELKEAQSDLSQISLWEKLGDWFSGGKNQLFAAGGFLFNLVSGNLTGAILDARTTIKESNKEVSRTWEDIAQALQNVNKGGEEYVKVTQELQNLSATAAKKEKQNYEEILYYIKETRDLPKQITVEWLQQAHIMGGVLKSTRESAESFGNALANIAKYLPYTEDEKGSARKHTARYLAMQQQTMSRLYQIFKNETDEINEVFRIATENKLKWDRAFDAGLFESFVAQTEQSFSKFAAIIKQEQTDMNLSGQFILNGFEEFMERFSQNSTLAALKWKEQMQKTVLDEWDMTQLTNIIAAETENMKKSVEQINAIQKKLSETTDENERQKLEAQLKTHKENLANQKKEYEEADKTLKALQKLTADHAATVVAIKEWETNEKIRLAKKAAAEEVEMWKNADQQELRDFDNAQGMWLRLLGLYNKKRENIVDKQREATLLRERDQLNAKRESAFASVKNLQEQLDSLRKAWEQETSATVRTELQRQIETTKSALSAARESLHDIDQEIIKADETLAEHRQRIRNKEIEEQVQLLKNMMSLGNEIVSSMDSILDNLDEAQQNAYEKELARIESWKEARLKAIEETAMSDEERIAATSEAERVAAQQSYQIELKKWQLEVQNLRRNQTIEASKATMSYAVAIMKAIEDYGVAAAPIIAMETATYAAQLGTIMSQAMPEKPTPPTYAEGTNYHEGGLAIVGDGGKAEVVEAKGKTFLTPNKPTLMNLPRGAKVYKDFEDYTRTKHLLNGSVNLPQFDDSAILDAISANRAQMSVYFDKDGMFNVVARNAAKNRYITKTLKINR